MDLMVGSTLQGGKYRLLEVLHQSKLGIIYRATHTYLERSVFLQTLNQTAQQRDDFAQLRQRFKEGARSIVNQRFDYPQVLDCFEEEDVPFIVLEDRAEFDCSQLNDWMFPSAEAVTVSHILKLEQSESQPIELEQTDDRTAFLDPGFKLANSSQLPYPSAAITRPATVSATETVAETDVAETGITETSNVEVPQALQSCVIDAADKLPQPSAPVVSRGSSSSAFQEHYLSRGTEPRGTEYAQHTRYIFQKPPKSKARFPVTLMVMVLLGGSVGVGMGIVLRLASAPSPDEDGTYRPRFSLFNREQSFPSQGTWPIQETPAYTPIPSIEEPVYRTTPFFDTPDSAIEYRLPLPSPEPLEDPVLPDDPATTLDTPLLEEWNAQDGFPSDKASPKEPVEPVPLPDAPEPYSDPPHIDELPPIFEDSPSLDSTEPSLIPSPLPVHPDESFNPDSSKLLPNTSVNIVSQ